MATGYGMTEKEKMELRLLAVQARREELRLEIEKFEFEQRRSRLKRESSIDTGGKVVSMEPGRLIPVEDMEEARRVMRGQATEPPPLGVAPRWIRDGQRAAELIGGLARYVDAGLFSPVIEGTHRRLESAKEWVEELAEIVRQNECEVRIAREREKEVRNP